MTFNYTGPWGYKFIRDSFLGCGNEFAEGETHHFRFYTEKEAKDYLETSFGWGSKDIEVVYIGGSSMSYWEKKLDNWCFENADCNLIAWKTADYRDPELMNRFIEFVIQSVPKEATHFVSDLEGPLDYDLYSIENDWEI